MKLLSTFLVLTILVSCNRKLELRINPLDPNYNTTADNLNQWGFKVTTIDHEYCIYKKRLTEKSEMYFYLHYEDNCFKTTGQGIIIELDTLGFHAAYNEYANNNLNKWFEQNRQEFQKDSLKIIDLLKTYNGFIASVPRRLASSANIIFNVASNNSSDIYECVYTAYPENIKTLTFEKIWDK
jgi:hypothetical protein